MSVSGSTGVWDNLDDLSDQDLALLLDSATNVLAGQPDAPELIGELPPSAVANELQEALAEEGVSNSSEVARTLAERPAPREVVMQVLQSVATKQELAKEIEETYIARRSMMDVGVGLLLAGTLFLLVLKLRRIRIGQNVEVDFYDVKAEAIAALTQMFGG